MRELQFTQKQNELVRIVKENKLRRLNILEGSVRSGKTWISLIVWAVWVASRPKDYLYMMCAKSLQTLKRNCLLPLQELIGEKHFTFSLSTKEGVLFGIKVMLEGAIYKVFSDDPTAYYISPDSLPHFDYINIGLDFGGSGSAHALMASGITQDFQRLCALRSEHIPAEGMTPQALYKRVYDFCTDIIQRYGKIDALYADSAEQTLISGLRLALKPLNIVVKNSLKRPINDRIRATTMLMAGGRFRLISEDCASLIDAFRGAVWDDKVIGAEVRLDNGTSDIDTLDAFEYSFERYIPRLIRSE